LCHVLHVSPSGYYAWKKRSASAHHERDQVLARWIVRSYSESGGTYGYPRVHADLRLSYGISTSRKRVARLMRALGLAGTHRRRRPLGVTRRDPRRPVAPDLVRRAFCPKAPDRLWVADITQHPTAEGWLYLAAIVDAFSRRVVGWSMAAHLKADLVVDALMMAVRHRTPGAGLIHHSDHGAQYTSLVFGQALAQAGITPSMGSVGDALDNAMAESFFATLQTELLDRHPWPTRQLLRSAIFEYIEVFYNRRRRHSALGYLSPDEFERRWLTASDPAIAS
jgi:putative transposase